MEFMTQGSLYHVIHSDREITLHRKFLMGRDIARGMLYLHSHKPSIVHRGTQMGSAGGGWWAVVGGGGMW
jgi:serine/threonine protein kinase